jgi:YidC/Oxa1 family membrane protein insertase
MEKRIFIAILLSIAFLWLWAAVAPVLFPELARKPEPPVARQKTEPAKPAPTTTPDELPPAAAVETTPETVPATPVRASQETQTVVETPDYRAVLSNRGGQIVSFRLKSYDRKDSNEPVDLVKARKADRIDYPFTLFTGSRAFSRAANASLYAVDQRSTNGTRIIEYRWSDGERSVIKTFRFGSQPYLFDFEVKVSPPLPYRVAVGPGIRTLGREEEDTQVIVTGNGVVQQQGDFEVIQRTDGPAVQTFEAIDYIGIEDNYFLTALKPERGGEGVLHRASFPGPEKKTREDLYAGVNATAEGVVAGQAFFGPKETELLDRYGLGEALQYGWFGLIARFLLTALVWINTFTHNYGWAIIVLTILIKIVLYPLQHKSIVSMKKMQKVQPKIESIRSKYKKVKTDAEQRQKMNVEMMQLYQKEGINPMAGCFPLLLQLPILWGFYNLLSRAIELRGAPFMLWIHDLSEKDPYYITPILMTATMFIQTYITPMTGDPAQRKIFLIMPLVFGFLFKDFPSGLVLYWLVQNVLTIIQQAIMNKWWKDHPDNA